MRLRDETVQRAVEQAAGESPRRWSATATPVRGGLEAAAVARVVVRYRSASGRARQVRFVVKELEPGKGRERRIYESVIDRHAPGFAPRLFATEELEGGGALLLLEAITPFSAWPWREERHATAVLERAAELHASTSSAADARAALGDWDYDAELAGSAVATLEVAERLRRQPGLEFVDRALPAIRRRALALASGRREVGDSFPSAVLHGDLHPGNVLLPRRAGGAPVLLDWGRARVGSPLEDVSSWLHSLVSFEPEARRRHDTWLRAYLVARGARDRIDSAVRESLWIAGASNALAGALRYQLLVAASDAPARARTDACRAAYDWCRIIRRADACAGTALGAHDRRIERHAASPP